MQDKAPKPKASQQKFSGQKHTLSHTQVHLISKTDRTQSLGNLNPGEIKICYEYTEFKLKLKYLDRRRTHSLGRK